MPITKLTPIAFEDNVKFRNIIINGDMSIAQRGTSATGLGNGDGDYHTCDRWRFQENGAPTGEFTQSQSTDVPSGQGFGYSLKMDVTTAQGSLAAADNFRIQHRIEGQNLQYLKKGTSSAESLTLSFWVKSNKTGIYIAELYDIDNARQISKSYTISSASTWEKKTITYAGDTTGAFGNDNGQSLQLNLWLASGTDTSSGTLNTSWNTNTATDRAVGQVNLADSTDNEWYITGVQLEAGTTASDVEFLPHGVNLARCQRYYYKSTEGNANTLTMIGGVESASSAGVGGLNLPVEMRANPTLSFNSGVRFYSVGSGTRTPSIGSNRSTPSVLSAVVSISSGTAGQAGYVYRGAANGHVIGDAEL